jgi:hypothetical protein
MTLARHHFLGNALSRQFTYGKEEPASLLSFYMRLLCYGEPVVSAGFSPVAFKPVPDRNIEDGIRLAGPDYKKNNGVRIGDRFLDVVLTSNGLINVTNYLISTETCSIRNTFYSHLTTTRKEVVSFHPEELETPYIISEMAVAMFEEYKEWVKDDRGIWVPPSPGAQEPADAS